MINWSYLTLQCIDKTTPTFNIFTKPLISEIVEPTYNKHKAFNLPQTGFKTQAVNQLNKIRTYPLDSLTKKTRIFGLSNRFQSKLY